MTPLHGFDGYMLPCDRCGKPCVIASRDQLLHDLALVVIRCVACAAIGEAEAITREATE